MSGFGIAPPPSRPSSGASFQQIHCFFTRIDVESGDSVDWLIQEIHKDLVAEDYDVERADLVLYKAYSSWKGEQGPELGKRLSEILRGSSPSDIVINADKSQDFFSPDHLVNLDLDVLRNQKLVVTAENRQSKSALIRKYLLGAQFLTKKIQDKTKSPGISLSFKSKSLLDVAGGIEDHLKELQQLPQLQPSWGGDGTCPTLRSVASSATRQVLDTAAPTMKWLTSQRLVSVALKVAEFEEIGLLDPYERQRARMTANLSISPAGLNFSIQMTSDAPKMKRAASDEMKVADEEAVQSLPVIHPTVDGRLKNVGRK
ncbi:hypothetical protein EYR36_008180 [Pleurotus pulmonarius]|nr:hypothetical protein EYR36_008180 [Pleurotus pulmonarius]